MKFQKKPVVVEATEWRGGSTAGIDDFCGSGHWGRADAKDLAWDHDDGEELVIYNKAERAWIPCPVGWWIVRGVEGELYPVKPSVFAATYEPVGRISQGDSK